MPCDAVAVAEGLIRLNLTAGGISAPTRRAEDEGSSLAPGGLAGNPVVAIA
jgi:hypothetical protein